VGWDLLEKNKTESASEFLTKEFERGHGMKVVGMKIVDDVAYIAANLVSEDFVMAFVVLFSERRKLEGYKRWIRRTFGHDLESVGSNDKDGNRLNFAYKVMSETEGPVVVSCPKMILDMLSPLDKLKDGDIEDAKQWRELCSLNNQLKIK
jgi:hypothetical protein